MATMKDSIGEALLIMCQGDFDGAFSIMNKAISESTNDEDRSNGYLNRATIYAMKKDNQNWIADLKKAADYGNYEGVSLLKAKHGIDYTPQKPSSSSAPNSVGSSATARPAAQPAPPPRPAAQPASKQNSKTKGVLVVDYSATMAKIMGRIITSRDMEVVATATDGEQAVKKYKELYPNIDLVTLNILMPDMDSVTVLKKILEFDKNAKVLMVAPEEGNEDELKECILTGAKSYVKKPLEPDKVLERIAAIMSNI